MGIQEFFSGKKILLTGHSGFKGSWLTHMLLGFGSEVIGYSLEPDTEPNLFSVLGLESRVKNHFSDIRDYKKVLEVVEKERPEVVIHMAAQPLVRKSYGDPLYTFETNVMGSVNVLEAMREVGCAKAGVMITTDKVYENKETGQAYKESDELGGQDPYSSSKAGAELAIRSYCRSFFIPEKYGKSNYTLVASARAGNVIGGGDWSEDRLVPDIIRAYLVNDEELVIRNPDAVRPWQHVLDPLYGYLLLAKALYEGRSEFPGAWNFAPPESSCIPVEDIVKEAKGILRKGSYRIVPDKEKHEMKTLRLDATQAKEKLEWSSRLGIGKTIEWTFDWYKNYYEKEDVLALTDKQIDDYLKMV